MRGSLKIRNLLNTPWISLLPGEQSVPRDEPDAAWGCSEVRAGDQTQGRARQEDAQPGHPLERNNGKTPILELGFVSQPLPSTVGKLGLLLLFLTARLTLNPTLTCQWLCISSTHCRFTLKQSDNQGIHCVALNAPFFVRNSFPDQTVPKTHLTLTLRTAMGAKILLWFCWWAGVRTWGVPHTSRGHFCRYSLNNPVSIACSRSLGQRGARGNSISSSQRHSPSHLPGKNPLGDQSQNGLETVRSSPRGAWDPWGVVQDNK